MTRTSPSTDTVSVNSPVASSVAECTLVRSVSSPSPVTSKNSSRISPCSAAADLTSPVTSTSREEPQPVATSNETRAAGMKNRFAFIDGSSKSAARARARTRATRVPSADRGTFDRLRMRGDFGKSHLSTDRRRLGHFRRQRASSSHVTRASRKGLGRERLNCLKLNDNCRSSPFPLSPPQVCLSRCAS